MQDRQVGVDAVDFRCSTTTTFSDGLGTFLGGTPVPSGWTLTEVLSNASFLERIKNGFGFLPPVRPPRAYALGRGSFFTVPRGFGKRCWIRSTCSSVQIMPNNSRKIRQD